MSDSPSGPAGPSRLAADLQRSLQEGRDTVLAKLEGLDEYEVRRPVVPSGTNLLGLVKHLAGLEWHSTPWGRV